MSYVKSSLGADEEIIMIGKFPWPYHVAAWGALLLLGVFLIGVIIWVLMLVHFKTTEATLTTRRIVYKKGLFTRQTRELGVATIEQIELRQGFWGRIFGFGVLEISGTGDSELHTHPMTDPVKFRRLVSDVRAAQRKGVSEPVQKQHAAAM